MYAPRDLFEKMMLNPQDVICQKQFLLLLNRMGINLLARSQEHKDIFIKNNIVFDAGGDCTSDMINLSFSPNLDTSCFIGLSAPHLLQLSLSYKNISDISFFHWLNAPKLSWVSLFDNLISDVSPLANLTSLTNLVLSKNPISDISFENSKRIRQFSGSKLSNF